MKEKFRWDGRGKQSEDSEVEMQRGRQKKKRIIEEWKRKNTV